MGFTGHPARGACGCFDGGNVLRAACNSRVHPRYFPDVSIGIREAAAEHEAMILHRVGVGDAAVRTGRVGKTVDLFLALAAYREHDFTAVAGRNGACGESFPLVVRQQHRSEEHTSELQSLMRISYA